MNTFSLQWNVEHCKSVPRSLWGFHVMESALAIPLNLNSLYFSLMSNPPPQAACNWNTLLLGHKYTYRHLTLYQGSQGKLKKTYIKKKVSCNKERYKPKNAFCNLFMAQWHFYENGIFILLLLRVGEFLWAIIVWDCIT